MTARGTAGRGASCGHRICSTLIDAIDQARTTDRRKNGRIVAAADFVVEAITAAAAIAQQRRGRPLPSPRLTPKDHHAPADPGQLLANLRSE